MLHDPTAAADQLAAIAARLEAVPMPPATLPGWQSLAATEYARAVWGIRTSVEAARAALDRARVAG